MAMPSRSRPGDLSPRRAPASNPGKATSEEIEAAVGDLEQAILAADPGDVEEIFNRLDGLPKKRASDVIAARLIENRSQVPILLLELLPLVGGSNAGVNALRRIARTTEASDDLRLEAKRMVGWPEDGAAARRRTFLRSLRDSDGALSRSASRAASLWPMRPGMFEETLGYLEAIEPRQRLAIVERLATDLPASGLPLLHAIVHIPDRPVQLAAIEALLARGYRVSSGALERLARTTDDDEIRAAALAAARRLGTGQSGSTATSGRPVDSWQPLPPVSEIFATIVDGSGGQSFQVARRADHGEGIFISYLTVARGGVWDYVGLDRVRPGELEDIVDQFSTVSPTIAIDLAEVRGGIALALETNEATRTPIPPGFEVWAPFAHERYPPVDDEPQTLPILDESAAPGDPSLVRASADLVDDDFFASWTFPLDQTDDAMQAVEPPKDGVLTDGQYRPLIERLADRETIAATRGWLRRQAWLYDREGADEMRDMALAVARSLGETGPAEWPDHPFLRALVDVSVYAVLTDPVAVFEDALMSGVFPANLGDLFGLDERA
jgi:hypothetical protein